MNTPLSYQGFRKACNNKNLTLLMVDVTDECINNLRVKAKQSLPSMSEDFAELIKESDITGIVAVDGVEIPVYQRT